MPAAETTRVISLAGTLVQLGVTLLVTALLTSLWYGSQRRRYFALWTAAWGVLTAALAAMALRHELPGGSDPGSVGPLDVALQSAYHAGKFGFLTLLLLGCLSFAGRFVSPRLVIGAVGAAVVAGLVLGVAADLNRVIGLQALFAIPAFATATWVVASTWRARRGVGVAVLIAALAGLTLLWLLYAPAFWTPIAVDGPRALRVLAAYNSYIDSAFAFVLALGMVVSFVEDTHAEADTARAQQVETLARSERRLTAILGAAHDGIVTLDADRRITAANPAAERIFGAVHPVGSAFDRFVHPDDREALWDDLATSTRRSEAHPTVAASREVVGLRTDGSEFPLEIAISSIGDEHRGYVVVARDLTERIRQRTERERLQHQVAQAARLEAVGRMVSGVAHELNNPLTAILAFGQDLLASSQTDQDREALTVIVQQAQRCRVIVGDLLMFARNRRDERRWVAPGELVGRVLRVFARDSARSGVALETAIDPDLPTLELDPMGIEQVITNLLTNAIQATPSGGRVTLHVGVRDQTFEVRVEDTGTGIPVELLPRVFEPFFTTKERGTGTGLGLSVSHAIVRQHGGTLEVANRPEGPGARFTMRLPFVERRAAERAGIESRGVEQAGPRVAEPGGPRRVLVVDDEESIREAIRRALERRGWSVDLAADGREALLHVEVGGRAVAYDAIVTDLRMPGMSGVELCRVLAARHPALNERTVVITGDTASPAVADFLAASSRPCLQKPFDMRTLAVMLDRLPAAKGGAA